jgi:hypothetical protein
MDILCQWVFCFVLSQNVKQCGRIQSGTKEAFITDMAKIDGTPGELLTAECVKKGERFQIDWSRTKK